MLPTWRSVVKLLKPAKPHLKLGNFHLGYVLYILIKMFHSDDVLIEMFHYDYRIVGNFHGTKFLQLAPEMKIRK